MKKYRVALPVSLAVVRAVILTVILGEGCLGPKDVLGGAGETVVIQIDERPPQTRLTRSHSLPRGRKRPSFSTFRETPEDTRQASASEGNLAPLRSPVSYLSPKELGADLLRNAVEGTEIVRALRPTKEHEEEVQRLEELFQRESACAYAVQTAIMSASKKNGILRKNNKALRNYNKALAERCDALLSDNNKRTMEVTAPRYCAREGKLMGVGGFLAGALITTSFYVIMIYSLGYA